MVQVWELPNRTLRQTFLGKALRNGGLAFSPNGKILAAATAAGVVELWNVESGSTRTLSNTSRVQSLAFSNDGSMIATGGLRDDKIQLWDSYTGEPVGELSGYYGRINSLSFSHDDQYLTAACDDGTVRIWNTIHKTLRCQAGGHSARVWRAATSSTGDLVASAGADGAVNVWEFDKLLRESSSWAPPHAVSTIAFSPDGRLFAAMEHTEGTIWVWDTSNGTLTSTIHGGIVDGRPVVGFKAMAFAPDGSYLAAVDSNETVALWNPQTGERMGTLSTSAMCLCFSQTGDLLATGGTKGVRIWRPFANVEPQRIDVGGDYVWSVQFSPDAETLAVGTSTGDVQIWDVTSRAQQASFDCFAKQVYWMSFAPDGKLLAVGGNDPKIMLLSVEQESVFRHLLEHQANVPCLAFSPSGGTMATVSSDKTLRLWDTRTWQTLATFANHNEAILAVAFSPDGRTLAFAGGTQKGISSVFLRSAANPDLGRPDLVINYP